MAISTPRPIGPGPIGPGPIGPKPPTTPAVVFDTFGWHSAFQKAIPIPRLKPWGGSPFVPKEAVLENTVTPDKWMLAFGTMPKGRVWITQPIYVTVAFAAADNTITPDKWLLPFGRMPRFWPNQPMGQPFVPKEATLENTTNMVWPLTFGEVARPIPKVAFQGYHLFVPAEATLANTITPDKWLNAFGRPLPLSRVRFGPPPRVIFSPPVAPSNSVTPDKWMRPLAQLPRRNMPRHTQPAYARAVPFVDNTATPEKWLLRWSGPPRMLPRIGLTTFLRGATGIVYTREFTAEIALTVDFHVCGWGTEDQDAGAFVEQGEQTDPWSEQDESTDDYDEQEECGR